MPRLTAAEIARALGARVVSGDPERAFTGYHFDSRLLAENSLFFALKTEQADGHAYLGSVAKMAGAGAVVERGNDFSGLDMPLIEVEDTTAAYQDLAAWVRQSCAATRYVGITGSAGKTTTKEFVSQILAHRFRTFASPGNWNNWLGMSFALLTMPGDCEFAVYEMAMSYPGIGEIARLAEILRPDITCLLNALPTHLEFLKTVENVARGKMQINDYLGADGVALINGDNKFLRCRSEKLGDRRVLFGHDRDANDIVLADVVHRPDSCSFVISAEGQDQDFPCRPLTGAQVENLFAAVLIARQVGMTDDEIRSALENLETPAGRGAVFEAGGFRIVDDTYNSNPESVRSLLGWAARAFTGFKVAVLGDMLELGEGEIEFHREIGLFLSTLGFDLLATVGERARAIAEGARESGFTAERIVSYADAEEAGEDLKDRLPGGATVVLKGSRGIGLDLTVRILSDRD